MSTWKRLAIFVAGFLFTMLLSSNVLLLLLYSAGDVDAEHESAHLLPFVNRDGEAVAFKVVTRNLVEGRPIDVCSADYPKATEKALAVWNGASGLGITAFRWAGGDLSQCNIEQSDARYGIRSAIVTDNYPVGPSSLNQTQECGDDSHACVAHVP